MVKEARALVRIGRLGRSSRFVTEYRRVTRSPPGGQGGRHDLNWRMDPASRRLNCMGDIARDAETLPLYHGLEIDELLASFRPHPRRPLTMTATPGPLQGRREGILYASQGLQRRRENLNIRVYGTKASLDGIRRAERADRERRSTCRAKSAAGATLPLAAARANTARPSATGGVIEAFAQRYTWRGRRHRREVEGRPLPPALDFPTIDDGVIGMAFIETAVKSARRGAKWVKIP